MRSIIGLHEPLEPLVHFLEYGGIGTSQYAPKFRYTLPSLLYGGQTLHIKRMEAFHQRCLRFILGICWFHHTPNNTILKRTLVTKIKPLIRAGRTRWLGHLRRMKDSRLPKGILFRELKVGKRRQCKPKQRWKNCIRQDFKELVIDEASWFTE